MPADWADCLQPIFRLKQRQPSCSETPLDKRWELVLLFNRTPSRKGSKAAAVFPASGHARKASGMRVMSQLQILDAQLCV
ncbi:hypothetical protein GT037_004027 [Alternaria burnsii]|uniref:Uncharacterized protein n=1 Tax=Alternaria burnsii TaxID=1187904 RepID=A0A8H7BFU7_9PLEO|nr:uncharacterized protein GT037_004027 [Alternaria burnsii]KAF7678646.1 hypothetical protein GT037_004027 [Alternaria burnsii]